MLSENRSWADSPCVKRITEKENHIRSKFLSGSLIDAVTTIWAVGYNGDSTSFTTNLTGLRIEITITTANSYDITELELQALREIVTIS
jgi:hypothetical protein